MKSLSFVFLGMAFIFIASGCACTRSLPPETAQLQIQQRLNEIFDAAEKKELDRLDSYHLYGPHFTKYSASSAQRQDAAAARKGEHDGLAVIQGLKMRADDLKIDVFGDVGIATFLLTASFESDGRTVEKQDHSTLVLVRSDGSWKIVHEHFSGVPPKP